MLIRYNTNAPWITTSTIETNGNHHHFSFGYQYLTTFWSILLTKPMFVTTELIWLLFLNILFFNFVPTPYKSLRFTRFRRSYVNHTAIVLTNHCQSYTAFLLDVRCSKLARSFFCSCLFPMIVHLRNLFLLSTRIARMLLTPRWVSRRKEMK